MSAKFDFAPSEFTDMILFCKFSAYAKYVYHVQERMCNIDLIDYR